MTAPFLTVFDREYAPLLGHRAASFRAVFAALAEKPGPVCIVETGCLRDIGNWAGDGQSTHLFGVFAAFHPGVVIAVDINPTSVVAARSIAGPHVGVVEDDSVAFLGRRPIPHIDLLYLDSLDFDGNQPLISATHHLFELCAAMPMLRKGSIVLVDDTTERQGQPFGKGQLIAQFMARIGAMVVAKGETQIAWML